MVIAEQIATLQFWTDARLRLPHLRFAGDQLAVPLT